MLFRSFSDGSSLPKSMVNVMVNFLFISWEVDLVLDLLEIEFV